MSKARKVGRPATAEHGTASCWRAGCRCDACREAHYADLFETRARQHDDRLAPVWDGLLADLAGGMGYGEACERAEIPPAQLRRMLSRGRPIDDERLAALDAALMEGRDEGLPHGTAMAWKAKCRCPECREAH